MSQSLSAISGSTLCQQRPRASRPAPRMAVIARAQPAEDNSCYRRTVLTSALTAITGVLIAREASAKTRSQPSAASASGYQQTGVKKLGSTNEGRKSARESIPGLDKLQAKK